MESTRFLAEVRACLTTDGKLLAAGFVLAVVILGFDLLTPLGVAGGVPYVALVMLCLWAKHSACSYLTAATGTVLTLVGYFLSPEGGVHWVVLTNRALAILAIWAVALFSAKRITELKRRELAQKQLQHAQKLESVGRLTGGIAHEFNNLLMVIFSNLEMIEDGLGEHNPLRKFTSRAMRGSRRGANLTQSLVAFSRKQTLEHRNVHLNGVILGMQKLFQQTLGETITIRTDLEEDLWPVLTDVGQIEATLLTFLVNGRDAMPKGGTIAIRTSNRTVNGDISHLRDVLPPGDYCALEVIDTGTGMTPDVKKHAFEPFFTTKDVGKGTGLGLSTVYGFAKQSGGHVEVDSEVGKGVTMRLYLPRSEEPERDTPEEADEFEEPKKTGGTILVLEDDPQVRALAAVQLTALGYQVIEAEDGRTALTILEEAPNIDLLFTDMVLPGGMSGPETVHEAREKYPNLKALFVSGYPEKEIVDFVVNGDDIAILRKPYVKSELAKTIAAAMNSD